MEEKDLSMILTRKSLPIKESKIRRIIRKLLNEGDNFSLGVLVGKLYRRYKQRAKEKIDKLLGTKYIEISRTQDFCIGLASVLSPRSLIDYGLRHELEALKRIFYGDPWSTLRILKISVANFYGYLQWLGITIDSYIELLISKGVQSRERLEVLIDTLHSASIEKLLKTLLDKWHELAPKEQAYALAAILNKVYLVGVDPEYPKINAFLKPQKQSDFDRAIANLLVGLAEKISPEETIGYLAEAFELKGLKTLIGLSINYPEFRKLLENIAKAILKNPEIIGEKSPMLLALQTIVGIPPAKILSVFKGIRVGLEDLAKFLVVLASITPDEEFLEFVAESDVLGEIFSKTLKSASPTELIAFFGVAEQISNTIIENPIMLRALKNYLRENFLSMIKFISPDVPILQALARHILMENREWVKSKIVILRILEYFDMPIEELSELLEDHELFLKHIIYNPLVPLPIPKIMRANLENVSVNEAYNLLYNLVIRTHHDVAREIIPSIITTLLNKNIRLKDASRLTCLATDQRLIDEDSKSFENITIMMRKSLSMAKPREVLEILDLVAKRIDNYVRCLRDFAEYAEYAMLEQTLHRINARYLGSLGYNKMAKIILRALSERSILEKLSKLRITQLLRLYRDVSRIRIVLQAKNELDPKTYEAYKQIISDPKINEKIYIYLQKTLRKTDKEISEKVLKLNKKYHEIPIFRAVVREFLRKTDADIIVQIIETALKEKRTIYDYAHLYTILRIAIETLGEKKIKEKEMRVVREMINSAKLPTNMKEELLRILG